MRLSAGPLREPQTEVLRQYYSIMLNELGAQRWWPARTRFEVILGAILTQNTNWHNAALTISRLWKAGLLTPAKLQAAPLEEIKHLIRSAGFLPVKTRTIRNFIYWLSSDHVPSPHLLFST